MVPFHMAVPSPGLSGIKAFTVKPRPEEKAVLEVRYVNRKRPESANQSRDDSTSVFQDKSEASINSIGCQRAQCGASCSERSGQTAE